MWLEEKNVNKKKGKGAMKKNKGRSPKDKCTHKYFLFIYFQEKPYFFLA